MAVDGFECVWQGQQRCRWCSINHALSSGTPWRVSMGCLGNLQTLWRACSSCVSLLPSLKCNTRCSGCWWSGLRLDGRKELQAATASSLLGSCRFAYSRMWCMYMCIGKERANFGNLKWIQLSSNKKKIQLTFSPTSPIHPTQLHFPVLTWLMQSN